MRIFQVDHEPARRIGAFTSNAIHLIHPEWLFTPGAYRFQENLCTVAVIGAVRQNITGLPPTQVIASFLTANH